MKIMIRKKKTKIRGSRKLKRRLNSVVVKMRRENSRKEERKTAWRKRKNLKKM